MKDILTPFFPCSLAEITEYLNRAKTQEDVDPWRIIRAANHAIAYAERRTARRLVARVYREPVDISCSFSAGDEAVTGAGFTALYVGDEVVGLGLQPGSRVASIASATSLDLDRPADEEKSGVTLSFGSERLVLDGTGGSTIVIPESPVQQLISAAWLDESGAETSIDLTGVRVARGDGNGWTQVILGSDTFPEGEQNILIACEAGYREPSATRRGDFSAWTALQRVCLRLAQVFFQDEQKQPGRIVDRAIAQVTTHLPDFRVPADIESELMQFARVG